MAFGVLAMACVALARLPAPEPEALLVRTTKGELQLRWTETPLVVTGVTQMSLAPSGNRVALWRPGGPMLVAKRTGEPEPTADKVKAVWWSPTKDELLYLAVDGGLWAKNLTTPREPAEQLAKRVVAAAWSPDGQRVAYAADGNVYVLARSTGEVRRALADRSPKAMAWSPDGRRIAVAEPGLGKSKGRLSVAKLRDTETVASVTMDADAVAWSPDSRRLWVVEGTQASVWDVGAKSPAPVGSVVSPPEWTAAAELVAVSLTNRLAWRLGRDTASSPLQGLLEGDKLVAWARKPGFKITNDLLTAGPFVKAPRPLEGKLRVNGIVDHADPLDGQFGILVQETVDARGRLTQFPRPVRVNVLVRESASQTDGSTTRPVRLIDLRNESEVSLVLGTTKLDASQPMVVENVWVAETSLDIVAPIGSAPRLPADANIEYDRTTRTKVVVPMVFPVAGKCRFEDDFLAPRTGHRHQGHDLMCPKLTPLVACFDGVVRLGRGRGTAGNTISVRGDNGWTVNYYHVNNDSPGTNDGTSPEEWVFAPGLQSGQRVTAGQFLGYSGNSGNAESTAPHCHFELWDSVTGVCVNPHVSLLAATKLETPQAKLVQAKVEVKKGESRWDGVVRAVDTAAGTLDLELWSKTEGGKAKSVTKSTRVKVKWADSTKGQVLGNENIDVKLTEVRAGLQAVLVGKSGNTGIQPRLALFAPPG